MKVVSSLIYILKLDQLGKVQKRTLHGANCVREVPLLLDFTKCTGCMFIVQYLITIIFTRVLRNIYKCILNIR